MKKCKVRSIKYLGKAKAYNVSMRSDQHNYKIVDCCGNGVYTKNSHSCAYSMLSYQTAWLKVYYPLEFMCNLLSSEIGGAKEEKMRNYLFETKRMGIVIAEPDINTSTDLFTIAKFSDTNTRNEAYGIRKPLTGIKGVGAKAVESITEGQPYSDLKDFLKRTNSSKVNKGVFEALVESGCMSKAFKKSKKELMESFDMIKVEIQKENSHNKKIEKKMEQFEGDSIFSRLGGNNIKI